MPPSWRYGHAAMAYANLRRMAGDGFQGRYGFYEAIDYTASRLPRGAVERGHSLVHGAPPGDEFPLAGALLLGRPMQRRSIQTPRSRQRSCCFRSAFRSTTRSIGTPSRPSVAQQAGRGDEGLLRIYKGSNTPTPEVQLLSNGRYTVMVTDAGGGYSHWKELAVTPAGGGRHPGQLWLVLLPPRAVDRPRLVHLLPANTPPRRRVTRQSSRNHGPSFAAATATSIHTPRLPSRPKTTSSCAASPSITAQKSLGRSRSRATRKLFSPPPRPTRPTRPSVSCSSRPKSSAPVRQFCAPVAPRSRTRRPLIFHLMVVHTAVNREMSYETDRLKFLGRGRSVCRPPGDWSPPTVQQRGRILTQSSRSGNRFSIDADVRRGSTWSPALPGHATTSFVLIEKYRDKSLADRVFDLAWSHGQVILPPA